MSKPGDTKKKIVEILSLKNETLTDISTKLDLAPSTVSQHLKEMLDAGTIRYADDRPRRWKYYEINYDNPIVAQSVQIRNRMQMGRTNNGDMVNKFTVPITVIVLVALIGVAAYTFIGKATYVSAASVYIAPGSTVPQGSTVLSISDAPTSYNITALYITVRNISIYSTTTGKWYYIKPQNATFNLIALRNISEILSGVNLTTGDYRGIVIDVSNITAVVNGTSEKVFLPTDRLTVLSQFNITNKSTNWINFDFNLQKSLHITPNGTIVMLPVVFVTHQNDTVLNLNQSYIIISKVKGHMRYRGEFGMDYKGGMDLNYTMPANTTFEPDGHGGFMPGGFGSSKSFFMGKNCLLIGNWSTTPGNYIGTGPMPMQHMRWGPGPQRSPFGWHTWSNSVVPMNKTANQTT